MPGKNHHRDSKSSFSRRLLMTLGVIAVLLSISLLVFKLSESWVVLRWGLPYLWFGGTLLCLIMLKFRRPLSSNETWLLLATLLCTWSVIGALPSLLSKSAVPFEHKRTHSLTMMTFNVGFWHRNHKPILNTIKNHSSDIVALQEVTPRLRDFLRQDRYINERFAYQYWWPSPDSYGLAWLSRYPLHEHHPLLNKQGRPFIRCAKLQAPSIDPLKVCNVHLASPAWALSRPGLKKLPALQQNLNRRTIETRQLSAHDADILLGDFNAPPLDTAVQSLTRHYVDGFAFAGHTGMSFGNTWPAKRWLSLVRIDYVFFKPRLSAAWSKVLPAAASDHRPVLIELRY